MELKDKLLASFMAFEKRLILFIEPHELRVMLHKNFENKGSQQKEEAWKYTSLNAILKMIFRFSPKERKTQSNLKTLRSISFTRN